jgi:hypothetical protein
MKVALELGIGVYKLLINTEVEVLHPQELQAKDSIPRPLKV